MALKNSLRRTKQHKKMVKSCSMFFVLIAFVVHNADTNRLMESTSLYTTNVAWLLACLEQKQGKKNESTVIVDCSQKLKKKGKK